MSRFRLAPKIGHLERLKRLYGYLVKAKHFTITYRTKEPDYSHLPKQEYEWTRTVHGNVKEEISKDIHRPLGKRVTTTIFLNVTENAQRQFQGSLLGCFEYVPYTALTIV